MQRQVDVSKNKERRKKSILDYEMTYESMYEDIIEMNIDEEKNTSSPNIKGKKQLKQTITPYLLILISMRTE